MDGYSGWLAVTAALLLAIVSSVNADSADRSAAALMSCEVCGSDGEVERAFGSERFEACQSDPHAPVHSHRQCPLGYRACVTRLQANGGEIVSKSCAERAVSGCHNINLDIYCYCTQPNCNVNANLPIRVVSLHHNHAHESDEDDDDQEGSADDSGRPHVTTSRPVETLATPKQKTSDANCNHHTLVGLFLCVSVALRTVLS
ncbi:uncharacterized protein LOC111063465 [Nilaparvata lugens]|uniref:uncharacterized protein LOC111063465 n=1 Tax=Nilaparvata lugens TaxID=108931 RepID=UPI00193CF485|nr:uncharacterized protein LOC111063465 [Nilaparvata lugens]